MQPTGLRAFVHRAERKSRVYSYEQAATPEFAITQLMAFKRQRTAWAYWRDTPPSYRKTLPDWVVSARQEATRARRLSRLIDACEQGGRI